MSVETSGGEGRGRWLRAVLRPGSYLHDQVEAGVPARAGGKAECLVGGGLYQTHQEWASVIAILPGKDNKRGGRGGPREQSRRSCSHPPWWTACGQPGLGSQEDERGEVLWDPGS